MAVVIEQMDVQPLATGANAAAEQPANGPNAGNSGGGSQAERESEARRLLHTLHERRARLATY